MKDLELLRHYEPVLAFTEGELFFPCSAEKYVEECSLWLRTADGQDKLVVPANQLTIGTLGEALSAPPGGTLYMRFVDTPLTGIEYQRWLRSDNLPDFSASGRLARVGLLSRFLSSFFNVSLLIRGIVPGGTTAAAQIQYENSLKARSSNHYSYYGRVLRDGDYVILNYLYFYAMNNWRSSYYGVNDHEADWEQVFIYLSENSDGTLTPRWVAYASHDFSGDDLRRHWNDPELQKVDGRHPIVFVAAGSHASYFEPGEYLMNLQPGFIKPVSRLAQEVRKFWTERLGQGDSKQLEHQLDVAFSVPFVDYARGDGKRIGPGQSETWLKPTLLTSDMGWVENYRGLWGLETRDLLGGERAPAGPKFNRNGSTRKTWFNPLGWAGLHKITPPEAVKSRVNNRIRELKVEQQELSNKIAERRDQLRQLELETHSLLRFSAIEIKDNGRKERINELSEELNELYERLIIQDETLHTLKVFNMKLDHGAGDDDLQSHITHKHSPEPPLGQQSLIIDLWAAISSGLLLFSFALLLVFDAGNWLLWVISVSVMFAVIEATLRGRLAQFLVNITLALAGITVVILLMQYLWLLALLIILGLARLLIVDNLREIRRLR